VRSVCLWWFGGLCFIVVFEFLVSDGFLFFGFWFAVVCVFVCLIWSLCSCVFCAMDFFLFRLRGLYWGFFFLSFFVGVYFWLYFLGCLWVLVWLGLFVGVLVVFCGLSWFGFLGFVFVLA